MNLSSLDTSFEAELRALIYLFVLGEAADAERLGAIDTLTINAKTFNLGTENLNGTHRLASGELYTRTALMGKALRDLALRSLTAYLPDFRPAAFSISSSGESLVNRLQSAYAADFFATAQDVIDQVADATTTQLTKLILTKTDSGGTI